MTRAPGVIIYFTFIHQQQGRFTSVWLAISVRNFAEVLFENRHWGVWKAELTCAIIHHLNKTCIIAVHFLCHCLFSFPPPGIYPPSHEGVIGNIPPPGECEWKGSCSSALKDCSNMAHRTFLVLLWACLILEGASLFLTCVTLFWTWLDYKTYLILGVSSNLQGT